MLVLVEGNAEGIGVLEVVQSLLELYEDVLPAEIPPGLAPMRDI